MSHDMTRVFGTGPPTDVYAKGEARRAIKTVASDTKTVLIATKIVSIAIKTHDRSIKTILIEHTTFVCFFRSSFRA